MGVAVLAFACLGTNRPDLADCCGFSAEQVWQSSLSFSRRHPEGAQEEEEGLSCGSCESGHCKMMYMLAESASCKRMLDALLDQ